GSTTEGLIMLFALLFAADPPQQDVPWYFSMAPLMVIVVIGYLLLLRPAQKQEQQRRALVNALKKGDEVVTQSGIIGVVETIKENKDEIVLRGGIRVTKSSVARIVGPEETTKEQKK